MRKQLRHLDRLPTSLHGTIEEFVALYNQLDGENLQSVTFYGDCLDPKNDPPTGLAASVLVVTEAVVWKLFHLADHGPRFGQLGLGSPLVLTTGQIPCWQKDYPIELIEIVQQHVTVCGKDHFKGLTFDADHVRTQCRRELQGMAVQMRQSLLAAGGSRRDLAALVDEFTARVLRVLRGLLRLEGQTDYLNNHALLDAAEKTLKCKLPNVHEVLDEPGNRGWDQYRHLLKDVVTLEAMTRDD